MLIHFFKSSYPLQYGILILLAILLWLGAFLHPENYEFQFNTYLNPAYSLVSFPILHNNFFNILIAFIISLTTAFIINYSLIKNEIIPNNSLLPTFVFIVISAISIRIMNPNPVLISMLFIAISIHNILSIYSEEDAFEKVFNSGFFIGLASTFYFPAIFFIIFIWITFVVFRLQNWREWIIALMGLITPYLFIFTWYFMTDQFLILLDTYIEYFTSISFFNLGPGISWLAFLIFSFAGILGLIAFFTIVSSLNENTILVRKKIWAIMWFSVIAILVFLISPFSENYSLGLLTVSISITLAIAFSTIKWLFWFEIAFGLFVLLILLNNLFTFS